MVFGKKPQVPPVQKKPVQPAPPVQEAEEEEYSDEEEVAEEADESEEQEDSEQQDKKIAPATQDQINQNFEWRLRRIEHHLRLDFF